MAYTYGGNKAKTNLPAKASNFSNLQMDAARNALTGVLGNRWRSYDATGGDAPNGSTIYSPVSNGSGSGFALTVPQSAAQFYIYAASAVTLIMGEDSTYTYGLFVPTATLWGPFDVANQQFIYIKPSSGTNTIYFQFVVI